MLSRTPGRNGIGTLRSLVIGLFHLNTVKIASCAERLRRRRQVKFLGLFYSVERMELAIHQYSGVIAVRADGVGIVRNQYQRPVLALFEQFRATSVVKAAVAHGSDLVDQETIELDGYRERKCQSCPHAARVVPDRLTQIASQFGKLLDERNGLFVIDPVHPANETQIVHAGQVRLKSAAKCQRP